MVSLKDKKRKPAASEEGLVKKAKKEKVEVDKKGEENQGYTAGGLSGLFGKSSTTETSAPLNAGEDKIIPKPKEKKKVEKITGDRDAQRENRKKIKKMTVEEKKRTVFVGNLPLDMDEKSIKKLFSDCGKVDSVRLRGLIPQKESLSKRIAHAKQEYNNKQTSLMSYVKFVEEASVAKALEKNGTVVDDHHIRVDTTVATKSYDKDFTVFIGNLPFNIQEEKVLNYFEKEIGPVDFVRLVKDTSTGKGKGIGFVAFKDPSSVDLALNMNGCEFEGRELRITKTMKKSKILKQNIAAKKMKSKKATKINPNQSSKIEKYKFSTRKNSETPSSETKKPLKKTAKKAIAKKKTGGKNKSLMK